jgi:ATPase subunit of ABC transporter with duplicated ATPase domains
MVSRMMLNGANTIILDEPTNHLDLESITTMNNSLKDFKGIVLFTSHDHELMQTVANRIVEITPNGTLDKMMTYDEYIRDPEVKAQREAMYNTKPKKVKA